MDTFRAAFCDFVGILHARPVSPDVPTARVLRAMRAYLDVVLPHWRALAAGGGAGEATGVTVELPLPGGRVLHGTLYQRPSHARGTGG